LGNQKEEWMATASREGLDIGALGALQDRFPGELIEAGDAAYEQTRRVWNQMIDRRPYLIARCTTVSDVVAAVDYARSHDLPIAVRGGGHNVAGTGAVDGGIVIDLSAMRQVQVDPEARIAFWADGIFVPPVDGSGIAQIRENVRLTTAHAQYQWVNQLQVWITGTIDLPREKIRVTAYAV
jgi:hypothetical protein